MKKPLFFAFCFLLFSLDFSFASSSPVVQVIAYKEPLGMYYSMQGWGSGSIIDTAGHILTNNHVVDNGFGDVSDDFAICLTEDSSQPPLCHYTASVIARDPDKDVALLQLDAVDIFGKPVHYTNFTTISPDYSYVPNAGDTVLARGYPWIGANTITETQGIVSGTYTYNNNTYIKTDTLIAGGNSGGPLIKDGKMIGINTFLIGGFFDPALGYSLSIKEAKSFIDTALASTSHLQQNSVGFDTFLQTINTFSQKKQLSDGLITMNFPVKYNVTTYIPGSYIDGQIAEESSTAVYNFSFFHLNIPALKTPEEIRYFLADQSFFPFWQDVKFKTVTIGGQSFYEVDTLGNTGGDKTKTQYVYFKIVDETHLLLLQLSTPFSNETTYDAIQKNISAFLAGITFPVTFSFPTDRTISVRNADIGVTIQGNMLVDFRSNFFPYNGVIGQLMTTYDDLFVVRKYLGNLWSYAQISVVPNSFYTEGTSRDDLFEKFREMPYFSQNFDSQKITYKGHEGFIVCDNSTSSSVFDERNVAHQTATCEAIFFVGENNSHFVSLVFVVEKRNKTDLYTLMTQFLDTYLTVSDAGETNFGTIQPKLLYADIAHQSQEFREALAYLVRFGILTPKEKFKGDTPLTWNDYAFLFVWLMYHKHLDDPIIPNDNKSPTFRAVLKTMPVNLKTYVNEGQVHLFDLLFRIKLAGVRLPSYTESSLTQFETQKDTEYFAEWKQIEDFDYMYYQWQKMSPTGGAYYFGWFYSPEVYVTYNPILGLSYEPVLDTRPIQFGTYTLSDDDRRTLDAELECTKSSIVYFSSDCYHKRQEYIWSFLSYPVLTRWEAISDLLSDMDFALWDTHLSEKKIVKIEDEQ